jgi:hypothetical protein
LTCCFAIKRERKFRENVLVRRDVEMTKCCNVKKRNRNQVKREWIEPRLNVEKAGMMMNDDDEKKEPERS